MLSINCLLIANTCRIIGHVFVVELLPDECVDVLRQEVKKRGEEVTENVPSFSLTAWRPLSFFPSHPHHDLANHVHGLSLNSEDDVRAATSLDPAAELQDYFTEPPPPRVVHVVIQLPPEQSLVEFGPDLPRVEAKHDTYDKLIVYLSTSRYVLDAPSSMSKPSEFQDYQGTENRILNDRPRKDVQVPPLALLYPPFGQFNDDLFSNEEPAMRPTDLRKLWFAVEAFASVMCGHIQDEKERQKAILPALNGIFESYKPFRLPPIVPNKVARERVSGGHANGPAPVMDTVVEFTNEFGSGITDPEIQYTSYFLQMSDAQMRLGAHKKSFEKHLCPTLGISIIGSYIGFGALLLLDKARHVLLTPLLSARSPSGDHTHGPMLFRAFLAACVLRTSIHKDTRRVLNTHTLPRIRDRYLPRIQKISAWPQTDDRETLELEFHILRVSCQEDGIRNENRFMYLARMRHQEVLVKFTRQYCPELHSFCAERHHAPKLLGYGTVPGGWKVVIMELVKHDGYNRIQFAPKHWAKWNQDLTRLVQDFHEAGLVHGDLRAANFIVPTDRPETIMLIDFDWGGEVGKVSFPTSLLNDELMDERMKNFLITKDHDLRVLTTALGRLRPIAGMDVS